MKSIATKLTDVQTRISEAILHSQATQKVQLVAVSKYHSVDSVRQAVAAGQIAFGENYLQPALEKIDALSALSLQWHFIGPLQSNKSKAVAENFDWLHTLDRLKLAKRLNDQRPQHLTPLNVCLQVNISHDPAKSGLAVADVIPLAQQISQLPNIKLRGLMCIPMQKQGFEAQKQELLPMQDLLKQLQQICPDADTLSMGMSGDLEAAVAAGATMVRIGTDIFGPRPDPKYNEA
ncbi:YggS family pyridoxal phosphate-dependent enzyme [Pelagibaculum spongiae]|uniref:Pyridoxal phosphate homeostasis protein n=1 Tax=Pelagibaculum spongiae TaxID=2080658 RepID=A0A2V1GYN9_9GAMM|nr:YggS family pyridoxal phosphate-dependent enzyme [Pelagibaculum spongiae]PVZ72174.1 YggS family pyridoxal phosphate-dependent enzyme [Pelagibaculum spongiae]